jgi:hypothetical protein
MRKILVTASAALFATVAIAASALPASAGGISFGFGGGYHDGWHGHDGWHDGYGVVVEVPIVDEDDYDDEDSDWDLHVEWCEDHYQTYDEDSDSYAYQVGKRTRCVSPYS